MKVLNWKVARLASLARAWKLKARLGRERKRIKKKLLYGWY